MELSCLLQDVEICKAVKVGIEGMSGCTTVGEAARNLSDITDRGAPINSSQGIYYVSNIVANILDAANNTATKQVIRLVSL